MGLAYTTFQLSLRKGRYVEHLQWDRMRKFPTVWDNLYGTAVLGIGDMIYAQYAIRFTEEVCPTSIP